MSGIALPENARLVSGRFSWRRIAAIAAALFMGGCAAILPQTVALRDAWPEALPEKKELADVPFFPQEEYQCGPAALATLMNYSGRRVTPEDLVPQVYIPERKGSLQVEMLAAPRRKGLVSYALAPRLEDVLREISAGNPVVVLHGYGVWPLKYWHYSVVIGYERGEGNALLRSGTHERQTMPFAVLEYTWKDSNRWAMVALPPDRIPATADETPYLEAINAMARVGDARDAAIAYGTFLKRWPDNLTATIGLANALHTSGHLKMSEAVLRDALKRHASSPVVLNNLAQVLSDQGRNREALELADRALREDSPFSDAIRETREAIRRRMK